MWQPPGAASRVWVRRKLEWGVGPGRELSRLVGQAGVPGWVVSFTVRETMRSPLKTDLTYNGVDFFFS